MYAGPIEFATSGGGGFLANFAYPILIVGFILALATIATAFRIVDHFFGKSEEEVNTQDKEESEEEKKKI